MTWMILSTTWINASFVSDAFKAETSEIILCVEHEWIGLKFGGMSINNYSIEHYSIVYTHVVLQDGKIVEE